MEPRIVVVNMVDIDLQHAETGFANEGELEAYASEMPGRSEVVLESSLYIKRLYTFCTCSTHS